MEGEPVAPDFGNLGKWLEKEPKLRDSVSSFGAGAVGDGECWADTRSHPSRFKV